MNSEIVNYFHNNIRRVFYDKDDHRRPFCYTASENEKYKAGGFIELICGKRSIQPELKVLFMEEKRLVIK